MLRWLKKWLPDHESLKREKSLQWLHHVLHHPGIWHLHRRAVAKGVAIGLFINFLPVPLQMLWAALLAVMFRANLPIAIVMTWINNPFTFIPINFFIYKVGTWITGEEAEVLELPKWEWHYEGLSEFFREFITWFASLGKAYFVGLPIVAIGSAILGYYLVQCSWKISVILKRKKRSKKYTKK
jgi:uncharacterized protein (DUF2062 family)